MPDKFSKETRSRIMGSIRARSKLEDRVSRALWKKGFRFRKNDRTLYGTPDISIKKYRIVIFIDSCYWHACLEHFKMPKSNTEFWENKIERNRARDSRVTRHYEEKGWNIIRIWEHDLQRGNFDGTIDMLAGFIQEAKRTRQNL
ncbi:very short patch repair endonuclease [Peribacillus deserti]|uniref:Very short patch repair endonuclease n=1 Tax=Peribacillus deserti TaxID=673318 RepID=A0A2N5M635_9BACI|nr:very short patch repair endonuclease [Peribacillus deserti]PLT29824.1 very short patch repair endonuclease [Peribacillus deserti]